MRHLSKKLTNQLKNKYLISHWHKFIFANFFAQHDATHAEFAHDEKQGTYYFHEKLANNPSSLRMRDIHYKTKFGVRPSGQDSYASVTAYYNLMGICSGDSFLVYNFNQFPNSFNTYKHLPICRVKPIVPNYFANYLQNRIRSSS